MESVCSIYSHFFPFPIFVVTSEGDRRHVNKLVALRQMTPMFLAEDADGAGVKAEAEEDRPRRMISRQAPPKRRSKAIAKEREKKGWQMLRFRT